MQITRTSQVSGKVRTLDLPITLEQLNKWQNGGHIQNIMPHLTPSQREFLITGIVDEEWKELFGDDEEETDEEKAKREEASLPPRFREPLSEEEQLEYLASRD